MFINYAGRWDQLGIPHKLNGSQVQCTTSEMCTCTVCLGVKVSFSLFKGLHVTLEHWTR